MAHHIYHTRGVILGSTLMGESNRLYKIFTEDIGLVSASAQSVREGKSKLRYVLQNFSFVTLDLVRGKEMWRITSAGEWWHAPNIKKDDIRMKLFARFCALLSRLLQGEGREPELFDDIVHVAKFLESEMDSKDFAISIEALFALRVLARLGYLDKMEHETFLKSGGWTRELIERFAVMRVSTLPKINAALRASHL